MFMVVGIVGSAHIFPSLLLILCTLSIFLSWNCAVSLFHKTSDKKLLLWVWIYSLAALLSGLSLTFIYHLIELSYVGIIGALLGIPLTYEAIFLKRLSIKMVSGKYYAVAVLTLTAPAMWIVAGNELNTTAFLIWVVQILFFYSGITFVNMLVEMKRLDRSDEFEQLWLVSKSAMGYHALLLSIVIVIAIQWGGLAGIYCGIGFLPLFIRQAWAYFIANRRAIPTFKVVGLLETVWTVWFGIFLVLALRS